MITVQNRIAIVSVTFSLFLFLRSSDYPSIHKSKTCRFFPKIPISDFTPLYLKIEILTRTGLTRSNDRKGIFLVLNQRSFHCYCSLALLGSSRLLFLLPLLLLTCSFRFSRYVVKLGNFHFSNGCNLKMSKETNEKSNGRRVTK